MNKNDLNSTAAGLAFVNSGTVPVMEVLNDPAAMALAGLVPSAKDTVLAEPTENEEEDREKKE